MRVVLCLLLGVISANSNPVDSDIPAVEPEYLDKLLNEGNYEEFSALLGIPDPQLAMERKTEGRSQLTRFEAMLHENLKGGDTLPQLESVEMGRQAVDFNKRSGSKWPNGEIPYVINNRARNNFSDDQRDTIESGIRRWNEHLGNCLKLVPRNNERDYVYVFSGNGCWSYIGRTGRQQGLSLQYNACLDQGTILHEFQHACGFHHEHNRLDRDNSVEVLLENIPKDWHDQYEKVKSDTYTDVGTYDYYSIMHYPMKAPGTNRDAFKILKSGINTRRMGNANDFTESDVAKIRRHYGCRS